jgi:hypothetical protein
LKDKKQIALLCFLTDIGIAYWSYLQISNYNEFKRVAGNTVDPEMLSQIYGLLMDGFMISMAIFLILHAVIFLLFIRESIFATKYVRFYTFMAALSAAFMIFSGFYVGIAALLVYGIAYVSIGKSIQIKRSTFK